MEGCVAEFTLTLSRSFGIRAGLSTVSHAPAVGHARNSNHVLLLVLAGRWLAWPKTPAQQCTLLPCRIGGTRPRRADAPTGCGHQALLLAVGGPFGTY